MSETLKHIFAISGYLFAIITWFFVSNKAKRREKELQAYFQKQMTEADKKNMDLLEQLNKPIQPKVITKILKLKTETTDESIKSNDIDEKIKSKEKEIKEYFLKQIIEIDQKYKELYEQLKKSKQTQVITKILKLHNRTADESIGETADESIEKTADIEDIQQTENEDVDASIFDEEDTIEAIKQYRQRTIQLNFREADAFYRLGMSHRRSKKYEDAIHYFQKAIRLNPGHANAYQFLGVSYQKLGNENIAKECFKICKSIRKKSN